MGQLLRLQFFPLEATQNDATPEEQKQLLESAPLIIPNLNSDLSISFFDDNYHLVIADQFIPLRNGTILKSGLFTIKINLQNSQAEPQSEAVTTNNTTVEIKENNKEFSTNYNDFALAELNREHSYLELSTLMQPENPNDELAFLFNNNSLQTFSRTANPANIFTGMVLSGSDPLSLLNQHFQPPEAKLPLSPIAVASAAEFPTDTSALFTEGNILRDLGFWSNPEPGQHLTTYTDALPSPYTATFGYRDDEDHSREKISTETKEHTNKNSGLTLKKLWQKLSPIN